jgi:hypothetical protein
MVAILPFASAAARKAVYRQRSSGLALRNCTELKMT